MQFTNKTNSVDHNVINVVTNSSTEKTQLISELLSRNLEFGYQSDDIKNHILTKLKYDNEQKKYALKWWYTKLFENHFNFDNITGTASLNFNNDEIQNMINNNGKYSDQSKEYDTFCKDIDRRIKRYQEILENIKNYKSTDEIYNFLTLEELHYLGF